MVSISRQAYQTVPSGIHLYYSTDSLKFSSQKKLYCSHQHLNLTHKLIQATQPNHFFSYKEMFEGHCALSGLTFINSSDSTESLFKHKRYIVKSLPLFAGISSSDENRIISSTHCLFLVSSASSSFLLHLSSSVSPVSSVPPSSFLLSLSLLFQI